MQKFEYKVLELNPTFEVGNISNIDKFNKLGMEGWELSCVLPVEMSSQRLFYFKRPILDD